MEEKQPNHTACTWNGILSFITTDASVHPFVSLPLCCHSNSSAIHSPTYLLYTEQAELLVGILYQNVRQNETFAGTVDDVISLLLPNLVCMLLASNTAYLPFALPEKNTVELKWLEHLWNHDNMFETRVVRASEF